MTPTGTTFLHRACVLLALAGLVGSGFAATHDCAPPAAATKPAQAAGSATVHAGHGTEHAGHGAHDAGSRLDCGGCEDCAVACAPAAVTGTAPARPLAFVSERSSMRAPRSDAPAAIPALATPYRPPIPIR